MVSAPAWLSWDASRRSGRLGGGGEGLGGRMPRAKLRVPGGWRRWQATCRRAAWRRGDCCCCRRRRRRRLGPAQTAPGQQSDESDRSRSSDSALS